jgi:hypothetical protein
LKLTQDKQCVKKNPARPSGEFRPQYLLNGKEIAMGNFLFKTDCSPDCCTRSPVFLFFLLRRRGKLPPGSAGSSFV